MTVNGSSEDGDDGLPFPKKTVKINKAVCQEGFHLVFAIGIAFAIFGHRPSSFLTGQIVVSMDIIRAWHAAAKDEQTVALDPQLVSSLLIPPRTLLHHPRRHS